MTLTDFEVGLITGMYRAQRHKNMQQVARDSGRSWDTVRAAIVRAANPPKQHASRRQLDHITHRRAQVKRAVNKRFKKDGVDYPVYCSAPQIAKALGLEVHVVRYDLKCLGLKCRVRKAVPTRDPKVLQERKAFADLWLSAPRAKVRRIIFSDEHTLSVNDHTRRIMYVARDQRVIPRERRRMQSIPRVMVWAAVGIGFKSKIVIFPQSVQTNADARRNDKMTFRLSTDTYIRRCLSVVAKELAAQRRIFQQDNASPHGRGSLDSSPCLYLQRKGIEVLHPWIRYSPDCSMIEHMWPILNERVSALRPTTLDELVAATKLAWESITQAEIDAVCAGFLPRLTQVSAAQGESV